MDYLQWMQSEEDGHARTVGEKGGEQRLEEQAKVQYVISEK